MVRLSFDFVLNTCGGTPVFRLVLNICSDMPIFRLFLNICGDVIVLWLASERKFSSYLIVHAQD